MTHIRKATVDDSVAMDACNRVVLPENYPLEAYKAVLASPESSCFLVENEAEQCVAYIMARIEYNRHRERTGHIISLGVLPAYRRKGLASQLIQRVEADLFSGGRRLHSLFLHVRKSNKGAIRCYQKQGLFRSKKVKRYYSGVVAQPGVKQNEDAYRMEKQY